MTGVEWLLIGGPADGEKVLVLYGRSVLWHGKDGKRYEYKGHDYLENGRMYRIGCVDPNDLLPSKVRDMIHSTGVRHIPGS